MIQSASLTNDHKGQTTKARRQEGTKPASEPETKAVKDFILSKSPYWLSFITIHSYGGLWLHHWENRTELTKKSFIRIVITIITVFWVTVILIALYLSVTNQ